ncbi:porin family protein [bacterium]|nr:porin family protein [bacterium]
MKSKLLICTLCFMPILANAAVPYRVQTRGPIAGNTDNDTEQFARAHRFYVGASYNLSAWQDAGTPSAYIPSVGGKNTSSFDISAGMRIYDTFRLEANYTRADAQWRGFSMTGDVAMINAVVDARMDALYRLFQTQRIVPYVGVGAGVSFNSAEHIQIDNKTTPAAAALAGIGFELGEWFTVDLGYRYLYIFEPKFNGLDDLAPTAHQFRAGIRVNF